jgi:hypothetical protein
MIHIAPYPAHAAFWPHRTAPWRTAAAFAAQVAAYAVADADVWAARAAEEWAARAAMHTVEEAVK